MHDASGSTNGSFVDERWNNEEGHRKEPTPLKQFHTTGPFALKWMFGIGLRGFFFPAPEADCPYQAGQQQQSTGRQGHFRRLDIV